jgi:hypothetical protein
VITKTGLFIVTAARTSHPWYNTSFISVCWQMVTTFVRYLDLNSSRTGRANFFLCLLATLVGWWHSKSNPNYRFQCIHNEVYLAIPPYCFISCSYCTYWEQYGMYFVVSRGVLYWGQGRENESYIIMYIYCISCTKSHKNVSSQNWVISHGLTNDATVEPPFNVLVILI